MEQKELTPVQKRDPSLLSPPVDLRPRGNHRLRNLTGWLLAGRVPYETPVPGGRMEQRHSACG